jgi:hypothetical protein
VKWRRQIDERLKEGGKPVKWCPWWWAECGARLSVMPNQKEKEIKQK